MPPKVACLGAVFDLLDAVDHGEGGKIALEMEDAVLADKAGIHNPGGFQAAQGAQQGGVGDAQD